MSSSKIHQCQCELCQSEEAHQEQLIHDALHSTKTDIGLRVEAALFDNIYKKGLSVTDTEMNLLIAM